MPRARNIHPFEDSDDIQTRRKRQERETNRYIDGDEKTFALCSGSPLREVVESKGGESITFPDLADRVIDELCSKRLSLAAAAMTLPLGDRGTSRRNVKMGEDRVRSDATSSTAADRPARYRRAR